MRKMLFKNPQRVVKLRKKFKLLDNKILKEKKRKISLKSFDITMPDNKILKSAEKAPKAIPMQIKALSLLNTSMTTFDLNKIDFDPVANPQTQEVFDQNYLNIGKVKILQGFERKNGMMLMNKPIYKEIDPKMSESLKEKNVLCKVFQLNFENLTIPNETFKVHDNVFFMNNVDRDQINAQQMNDDSGFDHDTDSRESDNPIDNFNLSSKTPKGGQTLGLSEGSGDFTSSTNPRVTFAINNSLEAGEFSNTILRQNQNNYAAVSFTPLVSETMEASETTNPATGAQGIPSPNSRGSIY